MTATLEALTDKLADIAAKSLEIEQRTVDMNRIRRADFLEYCGLKLAYAETLDEILELSEKTEKKAFWKNPFRKN